MRVKSIFILPVLLLGLIFVIQAIFPAEEDSNAEKGGSISGKIIEKESKKPIPNIKLQLTLFRPGKHDKEIETKTDGKGRYRFEKLEPAKGRIKIIALHPYCFGRQPYIYFNGNEIFSLKKNQNIVCNRILEIGGSVRGFVYKAPGIPFNNVIIEINRYYGSIGFGKTNEDGGFFIGKLSASKGYYIEFRHKISGHSYKFIDGIKIEKGKSTKIEDIVFNFDDVTGVEGYVKSSIDGKPLANARLWFDYIKKIGYMSFRCGEVYTDNSGYFYMRNLKPGKYSIYTWWPVESPKRNPKTGKPLYSAGYVEIRNRKRFFIDVEQRQISKIDINIDIPSNIITEGVDKNGNVK
jgi:hypothetical protein